MGWSAGPGRLLGAGALLGNWTARHPPARILALVAVLGTGMLAGAGAWNPAPLLSLQEHLRGLEGPWRLRGRLIRGPEPTRQGSSLRLAVAAARVDGDWRRLPGVVEVSVSEPPAAGVATGTRVEVFLSLVRDDPPANPGLVRRDRLRLRQADVRARLKSYRQLRIRGDAPLHSRALAEFRRRVREAADRHLGGRSPEAIALLLGERGRMADRTGTLLSRSGLIHLFALSGLHVGLIVLTAVGLARALGVSPRGSAAVGLGAAVTLATVVAPAASIRRAGLMAFALLLGPLWGRRHSPTRALATAAVLLCWLEPAAARDRGLLLSVAATTGLVVGLDGRGSGGRPGDLLRASCVAQGAVVPLLAADARPLALLGPLLNLLAVPLLGVSLALLATTIAIDLLGAPGAGLTGFGGEVALDALLAVAELGARGPVLIAPTHGWALAAAWWLALGLVLRGPPSRRAAGFAVMAGTVALAAPVAPAGTHPRLVALDVGQGDALLLQDGSRGLVVDGGGYPGIEYDIGAHLVLPALARLGVRRLDAVALSHAHTDHGGGLPTVVTALRPGEIWTGAGPVDTPLLAALRAAAPRNSLRLTPRGPGRRLGACRIESWTPPLELLRRGARRVDNDASLVLAVRCRNRSLLLTGDAGVAAEGHWPVQALRGGILKVGHHGSTTSTSEELLDRMRPRHAVISVGRRNPFGLPRDDVLERLRARGIATYRTDRDGALTITLGPRVRVRGERWSRGSGPAPRRGGD